MVIQVCCHQKLIADAVAVDRVFVLKVYQLTHPPVSF